MYIVEFKNGGSPSWLADWEGDPGRTLVRDSAKTFNTHKLAMQALKKAINENPHRNLSDGFITTK
jgi:hypothetical protein